MRITDRPRESSFPRCEIERRPGPKNDQRQIFRALCSLPAIQRDPKRGAAAWIERKGQTSYLLGPFPFAITISAPLSVPTGSIRFLFLRSFPTYRFAFDTQTLYAHVARVENGGRQFLFLRSKKHSSPSSRYFRGDEEVSRACKNISPSILNNIKKDINKTSSLDFSFSFFFSWLRGRRSESEESRTMSLREESRAFFF